MAGQERSDLDQETPDRGHEAAEQVGGKIPGQPPFRKRAEQQAQHRKSQREDKDGPAQRGVRKDAREQPEQGAGKSAFRVGDPRRGHRQKEGQSARTEPGKDRCLQDVQDQQEDRVSQNVPHGFLFYLSEHGSLLTRSC